MKILPVLLWACLVLGLRAEIPLAKNGVPEAEIIIDKNSDEVIKYAANELRYWVRDISGANLPVLNQTGDKKYKMFLQVNPEAFKNDLKKLKGNDGYAVRTKGNKLFLIASESKGILNGVFRLLYKNSDIIWARPNVNYGTFFTKNPNLSLKKTDYIDIPVYKLRGWQMIGPRHHMPSEIWQVRNGNNWSAATNTYNKKFVKFGNILEFGGGHNLVGLYITEKKYFKKHPDFFPLIDGKRTRPSETRNKVQLCFTNPEMTKAFISEIDKRIKAAPDYDTYRIMIEDNYNLCNCSKCLKDITLDNGKVIKKDDPAFRSSQFFLWLNQIARHMEKFYPGKKILTFGYFFTEIPPLCKVEPNISISLCPIYKNSKASIESPLNAKTKKKIDGWLKITDNITLREYYGLSGPYPRPVDAIAISDWKYASKHGIDKTYSEMYADAIGRRMDGVKSWNVNAPYFWAMTIAPWNPDINIEELRNEFFERVYGPAAEDVKKFYKLTEKGWLKSGGISQWNDKAPFVWRCSVREQGLADQCRKALKSAAMKVKGSKAKKMLAGLRETFEEQIELGKPFHMTAKKVEKEPDFDPDFCSGEWKKAVAADKFAITGSSVSREKTSVKVLYDNKNLYFGIKCFDKEPAKAFGSPAGSKRDKWPAGDKFELFVTGYDPDGKVNCNQIVFDINGNIYDSRNKDKAWNAEFKLERKTTSNGWSAFLTLPAKTLNVDLCRNPKLRVMFVRYWNHKSPKMEVSFWRQGVVHNFHSFGDLKLD